MLEVPELMPRLRNGFDYMKNQRNEHRLLTGQLFLKVSTIHTKTLFEAAANVQSD